MQQLLDCVTREGVNCQRRHQAKEHHDQCNNYLGPVQLASGVRESFQRIAQPREGGVGSPENCNCFANIFADDERDENC